MIFLVHLLMALYIFINKTRDKVKLLHWSGYSFILYYKPLELEIFEIDQIESISLTYSQLVLLIDGISITNISRRKRYKFRAENV